MLEILEYEVYGLENAKRYSGLPMVVDIDDLEPSDERMEKLCNAKPSSGHDCSVKGILVTALIKYPGYWTPQFQRYHFADIISSQSKMHRLTKMDVGTASNKYVDYRTIEVLREKINIYNFMVDNGVESCYTVLGRPFTTYDCAFEFEEKMLKDDIDYVPELFIGEVKKYEAFMEVISNCPMGFEMVMAIETNYLQLKTIYEQRKHHKLVEDWGAFCKWCETLPKFVDYCLKGKRLFTENTTKKV